MYSSAVFTALLDLQDLALALASHSACFQKLGGHEGLNLSLRDIQLALVTSKYPEDKAFKLYERQGECYPALGIYRRPSIWNPTKKGYDDDHLIVHTLQK